MQDAFKAWFKTLKEEEIEIFVAGHLMATAAYAHVDNVEAQMEVINQYVESITSK